MSAFVELNCNSTVCFIMFSVITNIYNKKTKGPTLMESFTATGKLEKVLLTTRDVRCVTTGDMAHIDTIFKLLPHTRHISSCQKKKNFFSFSLTVNNSIKVGPLVFSL